VVSHVHEGEWCAKCVEHGVAEEVRRGPVALEIAANDVEALEGWEGCGDIGCHWSDSVSRAEVLAILRPTWGEPDDARR